MEANVEMNPTYVLRLTRLEAARSLVDPKELQSALREMLDPDTAPDRVVKAIEAVANGNGHAAPVKALPAGPSHRKAHRIAIAHKKGGPKPGRPHGGQSPCRDQKLSP